MNFLIHMTSTINIFLNKHRYLEFIHSFVCLFFLGQNFVTPPTAQADVRLRRRLSDKDKERRLVRRSSSKRKDKENGGGTGSGKTAKESGNGSDSPAKTTSGSDLTISGGNQVISGGNQVISGGNTVSSSLDLVLTDPYTLVPDHHQYSSASHGVGGTNICSPSSEENSGSNQNPDNNRSAIVALKRTSSAETGSSTIPSTSVSGGIVGLPVDSGSLPVQTISGSGNVSNNNHSLLCRTRSEDAASSSNEVSEAALTRSLPRI